MIFNEEEVLEIIQKKSEKLSDWVHDARKHHKELKALVTGDDFCEELINRIEHLESTARAVARKKYAKDIRDMFNRVMVKRQNVFDANGGSEQILIKNDTIKNLFEKELSNFKSNKSLYKYLSENYFNLTDIDPNGVIMLEYKTLQNGTQKAYPTYKSINDIWYYEANGQLAEYIIFTPKQKAGIDLKIWRLVDDKTDWVINQIGTTFIIDKGKSFEHPFGKVPLVILSEKEEIGCEKRLSPINTVIELSKDYARDKSILTIYKFQNGFPLHWRYVSQCNTCRGTGKTGNVSCTHCDGKGYLSKGDVTDMVTLPLPKEGQPNIAPNIAGFISPDLTTWKQYKEDLRDMENLIEDTLWGTDKTHQTEQVNETATGRFIDIQPITNALNQYSDTVEYVYNTLANFALNFVDTTKQKDEVMYYRSFGRRYIIESPDVLLDKYEQAKEKGDSNTILDKLLEEFILSKYKTDPKNQAVMLKKAKIEPYIHLSIEQTNAIFGKIEANKKILFHDFWIEADKQKDANILKEEFNQYFNTNNKFKENESL